MEGNDGAEGALHHRLGSLVGQVCGEYEDLTLLLHVLCITGGHPGPGPGSTLDPKWPHPSPEPSSIRAICQEMQQIIQVALTHHSEESPTNFSLRT